MIGNLRPASDTEIERLLANPPEITRFLYGSDADQRERADLDRAWHAIHFALTGSRLDGTAPLNFLVSTGQPVGDVDVGFGPARVLRSPEVSALAAALDEISAADVRGRVDLARLDAETIYPGHWQANGRDVEYVVRHYERLKELVARAAARGEGLVLYIN